MIKLVLSPCRFFKLKVINGNTCYNTDNSRYVLFLLASEPRSFMPRRSTPREPAASRHGFAPRLGRPCLRSPNGAWHQLGITVPCSFAPRRKLTAARLGWKDLALCHSSSLGSHKRLGKLLPNRSSRAIPSSFQHGQHFKCPLL